MKGVAGVGKTVLTQKFSLDWAEGRANQDIQLLFPFTFRELNVLRDRQFSLVGLLHHFFSESVELCIFQDLQVVFIFDGLDECRLPLDFIQTQVLTEATESSSVEMLVVNLIRGTLLPFAQLWITTRPAAANQIPAEYVSMVTEVRGFTDPQKEQYFRKRFRDQLQATTIISHIKMSPSLHIMCHIPVFCWIISTVLQHVMETRHQLPQTMTQMYIHFLVVQAKVKSLKYDRHSEMDAHWTPETRKMVESLGKLAFEQLQRGNLIFYESDLSKCGLNPTEASVYSGVFTQIFREEPGLYQDKVYCFIHLSVQEFLAALHVHLTFFNSGVKLLSTQQTSESPESEKDTTASFSSDSDSDKECFFDPEVYFYRSAVDQALQSPNGHLDLLLRFLLGLSLPNNQSLLRGLLTQTGSDQSNHQTAEYIQVKLDEGLSAERSMNLLHCLNELNSCSLLKNIHENMKKGCLDDIHMSPAQWSAMVFLLRASDTNLEFDLKKYSPSETALLELLPVVKVSTKAILSQCNLSQSSCGPLSSVLRSFSLTLMDLSNNDLQDSGVELLCSGLKSSPCRLEILRLSGCLVSEEGAVSLASALSFAHSNLKELDLSYNHPGPSAELLTALQKDPNSPLNTLRLEPDRLQYLIPGLRKYFCELTPDPVTTLHQTVSQRGNKSLHSPGCHVLSSTGLTGRCYWEVNWELYRDLDSFYVTNSVIHIAVCYRGICHRKSEDCEFGDDNQSWNLRIYKGESKVCHNKREMRIHQFFINRVLSGRVGVYLDSEAGSLSFYRVRPGGELGHHHTFSSTFTEPLFPVIEIKSNKVSVSLADLSYLVNPDPDQTRSKTTP